MLGRMLAIDRSGPVVTATLTRAPVNALDGALVAALEAVVDQVIALLEDLGLRRTEGGRAVYDERQLCHSPQERLFVAGQWHDGLLPPPEALPAAERNVSCLCPRCAGQAPTPAVT